MLFEDVIFPTDISFNSPGGPEFLTAIVSTKAGFEISNIDRPNPIYEWDVGYGARKIGKIYDLYQLFLAVAGQGHQFLFKFWLDYKSGAPEVAVTPLDQVIAVASAGQSAFQLIKKYQIGSASYTRTIKKPKAGTLRVSVNDVEETTGWVMNSTSGVITRTPGLSGGQTVKAGYEYFFPVRFAIDKWNGSFHAWEVGTVDVRVRQVLLQ